MARPPVERVRMKNLQTFFEVKKISTYKVAKLLGVDWKTINSWFSLGIPRDKVHRVIGLIDNCKRSDSGTNGISVEEKLIIKLESIQEELEVVKDYLKLRL